MNENKFSTYLLYAVGEIILVVVGILIAVQIDDWNEDQQRDKQQLKYFRDIITDLKKDSIHLQTVLRSLKAHQKTHHDIYDEIKGDLKTEPPFYDYLLYNIQFAPTMVKNQQLTIDKITNHKVRQLINDYSEGISGCQIALDEYNMTIIDMLRPYTLSKGTWDEEAIFNMGLDEFLPKERVINTDKIRSIMADKELTQLLSYVRMSTGFGINEVSEMIEVNSELTKSLQKELK